MNRRYHYNAFVRDVYDGDTITVDIDFGMDLMLTRQRIRLAHINAPELKGVSRESGIISRRWLRDRILGRWIELETLKSRRTGDDRKGKFGRWLGVVWIDSVNINQLMLDVKLADPYKG